MTSEHNDHMNVNGRTMKACLVTLAVFLSLVAATAVRAQSREVIGYYPSWKWTSRNNLVTPARIPYDKLTIINYAFFVPHPDGWIVGKDSVGDALYLKDNLDPVTGARIPGTSLTALAHTHGVKVMLSLGGWEDSDNFPAVAAGAETRARFAHSCIERIREYGFDGIDIDWEYPGYEGHKGTPQDRENFTLLLRTLKDSLVAHGKHTGSTFLLTAAVPAGMATASGIDMVRVADILDMVNIMTYDFHGPWDRLANHNAPLYSSEGTDSARCIDGALKLYHRTFGIPASKINLGVPFYGQTFASCATLNSPHTGADTTHFSTHGAFYYDIVGIMDHFTRSWDDRAKVPYLVSKEWNMLISYDDEESVGQKAQYVLENKARGLIIWEITGDFMPDGTTPLLDVIHNRFSTAK